MTEDDRRADFREWAAKYGEFYELGSRLDTEFRFTRQVVMAARKWTSFIDETIKQATGHSRARWQTLFTIAFSEGPIATLELSERQGVRWPTLIRTLNELEKLGMITRDQSETDRRSRLIGITDKGMEVVESVKQVLDPTRSALLESLSEEEMLEAEVTLRKFQILISRATGDK